MLQGRRVGETQRHCCLFCFLKFLHVKISGMPRRCMVEYYVLNPITVWSVFLQSQGHKLPIVTTTGKFHMNLMISTFFLESMMLWKIQASLLNVNVWLELSGVCPWDAVHASVGHSPRCSRVCFFSRPLLLSLGASLVFFWECLFFGRVFSSQIIITKY